MGRSQHKEEAQLHYPSAEEYLATGILGVFIYCFIIYLSASSIRNGVRSKSTKRFFLCMIFLAVLELPRFLVMSIQRNYDSRVAYSFHLIAGIFFFVAFSIVCRQWSQLLQLGSYFRAVYGLHGLILSNISFAVVDLVAVVACLTAASLHAFFFSTEFAVITFIEAVRNVVYSIFLSYYGVKLVRRFWHFSRIERQQATNSRRSIAWYICACCSSDSFLHGNSSGSGNSGSNSGGNRFGIISSSNNNNNNNNNSSNNNNNNNSSSGRNIADFGDDELPHSGSIGMQQQQQQRMPIASSATAAAATADAAVFTKVVLRMTAVLVLSSICFMLRVAMLAAKMIALHNNNNNNNNNNSLQLSSDRVPIFGLLWFIFSDFLPRSLPCLAFIFLMRTKRPAKQQVRDSVQHKLQLPGLIATGNTTGSSGFLFSPLALTGGDADVVAAVADDDDSNSISADPFDLTDRDGIVSKSQLMLKADHLQQQQQQFARNNNNNSSARLLQYEDLSRQFPQQDGLQYISDPDEDELSDSEGIIAATTAATAAADSRSSSRGSNNLSPDDFVSNNAQLADEPRSFEDSVVDNILSFVTFGTATTETLGSRTKQQQQQQQRKSRTFVSTLLPPHHDTTTAATTAAAITNCTTTNNTTAATAAANSGSRVNFLGRFKSTAWSANSRQQNTSGSSINNSNSSSISNSSNKNHNAAVDVEAVNLQDNNYSI